jgi:hypothetical protein
MTIRNQIIPSWRAVVPVATKALSWRAECASESVRRASVDVPAVLSLILAAAFAAYAFANVHFGIRDGGLGDDSHRLLIAYRLVGDLSSTWNLYLSQPWPPLPYILQVLTHRVLSLFIGVTDRQFIQSALFCSIIFYALHLVLVVGISRRLKASAAGLLYIVGSISAGSIVILAVSAMAEAPTLFFLASGGWLLTFKRRAAVATAALMLLAASLCRSEVAVISLIVTVLVALRHGIASAAIFAAIALAAAGFKTLYALSIASDQMSYLNLSSFYWVGDTVKQRLGFLLDGFVATGSINSKLSHVAIVLMVVSGLTLLMRVFGDREPSRSDSQRLQYASAVTVVGLITALFVMCLCALGKISWDVRYQLMPLSIIYWGLCLLIVMSSPSSTRKIAYRRAEMALAIPAFFVGVSGLLVSFTALEAVVPSSMRQARDFIVQNAGPDKRVIVDALMFWDTYPLVHAIVDAQAAGSACVYDTPPVGQTAGMKSAIERGESWKTVNLLGYVDQYDPKLLVMAGRDWRKYLDSIPRFMDNDERASYILPSITWRDEFVDGELSLTKIGSDSRFRLSLIFENRDVRLYRIDRLAE